VCQVKLEIAINDFKINNNKNKKIIKYKKRGKKIQLGGWTNN
jgi:hypothetical protein